MLDEILGHYAILDAIGPGRLGDVYRARDTRLGRTVAITELRSELAGDPDYRQRFLRDARAWATLSHPNIATLYEASDEGDSVFLVSEFVPGEPLEAVIAGRPLNPRRAVNIAIQIADALAEAHAADVTNRLLRTADVVITPKGNAKLLEFGLAMWASDSDTADYGRYLSPEQVRGDTVDTRTDIFSLGAVMFQMLTGRPPFTGASVPEVARQIVEDTVPPPSAVNRGVPRELDPIVSKALAKDPANRYEALTLSAELRAVAAILDARSQAAKPITLAPVARKRNRARAAAIWILMSMVVPAALAAVWLAGTRTPFTRVWRRTVGAAPAPVVAVLPLSIQPPDPDQAFIADGLTRDLVTRLGQTPGLRVVGRSVNRLEGDRPPADIARLTGAKVVLTGTVRPQGDTVNLSLALVDPSDGSKIWGAGYASALKDIFAIDGRIAGEVARALRVETRPTAGAIRTSARTTDANAYRAYARGRQAAAEGHPEEALRLFDEAIAADPGLAEAYAAKAGTVHARIIGQGQNGGDVRTLAEAADRAHQLDPDLPEANVAMAAASTSLAAALTYLRHAIEADPSFSAGFEEIGNAIQDFDPMTAIAFYRKSLEIDPRRDSSRIHLASTLLAMDRWDDAANELDMLPPGSEPESAAAVRAIIDIDRRQFDRAVDRLRRDSRVSVSPVLSNVFASALRLSGRTDDALQAAAAMIARGSAPCDTRAIVAGLRLEKGQARAARPVADPVLREARQDTAPPAAVRCGATMAAAMNDASRAASLLARIAEREDLLRYWALDLQGERGSIYFRGRLYPWTNIIQAEELAPARERLQAAYAAERNQARKQLDGLVPGSPQQ